MTIHSIVYLLGTKLIEARKGIMTTESNLDHKIIPEGLLLLFWEEGKKTTQLP